MSWNSLPQEIRDLILIELSCLSSDAVRPGKANGPGTELERRYIVRWEWNSFITSYLVKVTPIEIILGNMSEAASFRAIEKSLNTTAHPKSKAEQREKNIWLDIMIRRRFASCLKLLLEAGANFNNTSGTGRRDIQEASRSSISVAEVVLDYAADIKKSAVYQASYSYAYPKSLRSFESDLLYAASTNGLVSLAAKVIDRGSALDTPKALERSLHGALANHHTNIAELLLKRGASSNSYKILHTSPLFIAAETCDIATVSMLIGMGADVNYQCDRGDALLAAIPKNQPVARYLISKGANITAKHIKLAARLFPKVPLYFIGLLLSKAKDLCHALHSDTTKLYHAAIDGAAEAGNEDLVKHFLDIGVKPSHIELEAVSNGYVSIVKKLLDAGADPNIISEEMSSSIERKGNALYRAASIGSVEMVRLFLEKRVPINSTSGRCRRAVMVASFHGHAEVLKVLLSFGAETNTGKSGTWGSAFNCALLAKNRDLITDILYAAGCKN